MILFYSSYLIYLLFKVGIILLNINKLVTAKVFTLVSPISLKFVKESVLVVSNLVIDNITYNFPDRIDI